MRLLASLILGLLFFNADVEQRVLAPSAADLARIAEQRKVITRYLAPNSMEKLQSPAGKLRAISAILAAEVLAVGDTYELQSLGIVLGDAFVQELGFSWVVVEDDYGRDPAIRFEDTSVIAFPLTMISKRIERGEKVDVFDLFNGVAAELRRLIDEERAQ